MNIITYARKHIVGVTLFSLLLPTVTLLFQIVELLPGPAWLGELGHYLAFLSTIPVLISFFLSVPVGVCLLILSIFWKKNRHVLVIATIVLVFNYAGFHLAISGSHLARDVSMAGITRRSSQLIDAIEQYKADQGSYPASLTTLVPQYLAAILTTGVCGYPTFEYSATGKAFGLDTGGYHLYVNTPLGGLNWDIFFYWPSKNYPEGNDIQRIGDWAYLHE